MYTMIVADDERWIRERIINSINWEEIGVTVAGQASDGEEALELCKSRRPDIVLTDIRMPAVSGLEFIIAIKECGINPKIIIISGYNDFSYAQKAIKLGVFDYILKPVENSEMIEVVKKCIRQIEIESGYIRLGPPPSAIEKNKSQSGRMKKMIEKAKGFIDEHYTNPITQRDVAESITLNTSYFSKIFREETGESFTHYLARYRIGKAVELMKDPTLKVYEIAGRVGYDNVQYFIKIFRQYTGLSPNQYRDRN
ncbi:DNA-binding response regulator [Spirochaetia bacterium]|nr:DNA-binding response regulator [Spirochaetia bacterium]